MADDLKRVGLVFQADGAVDFKKSLQEINASVQENRSAFKLAQSQWDKNTKSVDKLKDRQKYLSEQTKDYSDKVKLLETQLKELENAEVRDEKAIQSKQNQLNTARTSLNHYQDALEEVNGQLKGGSAQIKEYGKKIESFGDGMTNVGKKLTTHVSAPIAALGGLAIKSAMELDEGYDTIITKTGATGDALQDLNDVADEIFGSMPVEMADVGVAVGEVNTRFGMTGDVLRDVSKDFIRFSEINGVDLNASIGTVDKIMTQFGVDSSKTGEILGILTARSQETGIATDVLMNSVSTNSATFQELGFSVENSINLLAQFEQNGVNSSVAMTGLQKAVVNMAKDGKTADEALVEIVDSIKNAKTETEAINKASEVFGTKGAVQMTNAIRDGRFNLDQLKDSMANYGNVVQETYETTQDPWDKMKTAMNDLKLAGSDLAGELFETLAPIIDEICKKIEEFTNWFKNLDENTKEVIVKIGLFAMAIGPLLAVLGPIISGVGKLVGSFGNLIKFFMDLPGKMSTLGGAFSGLWGIMKAHPIGALVAIIGGALVGAFIWLWNNCESFREFWINLWEKIKAITKTTVDAVSKFFQNLWNKTKEIFNGIKNTATSIWTNIKTAVTGKVQEIKNKCSEILGSIKANFFEIWNSIKSTVSNLIQGIKSAITSGIEGAKSSASRTLEAIKSKFSSIFESAKTIVKKAIDKIKGFFNFSWSLPKIKLPHFSIKGKFNLNPPSIPSFGVSWYAKGGILNKPTIFGRSGDNLLGGGEAGKEAVLPISLLKDYIREENRANNGILVGAIKEAMSELSLVAENNIYIGDRKVADVLTDMVTKKVMARTSQYNTVKGRYA